MRCSTLTACCPPRAHVENHNVQRVRDGPQFRVVVDGEPTGLAFHGVPSGHEFNSFVLGLYNVAGPGQPLGDDLIDRSRSITDPLDIMVLVSLT